MVKKANPISNSDDLVFPAFVHQEPLQITELKINQNLDT